MASFRDYVVRASQHTYFLELKHLRFQILFFAGLVLVPLCCGLGWPTTFAALTDNLLFVDGWSQVFIIFLLCLISSWTGMVMIFIVLDLGPRRFGVTIAPRQATAQERRRDRWNRLTIFGLPILAPAIGMLASRTNPLYVLLGLILAILAGVVFLWITTVLYYMALPIDVDDNVDLLLPVSVVPKCLRGIVAWREWISPLVRILVKWKGLSVGYFDGREILYAQHLVMTALALMVALFYAFVIVVGLFALRDNAWAPWMTAYSYLELGWLLLGIILAGLAFFFDGPITAMGLHVPTLVLVVVFIYCNSSLGNFYQLVEPTAPAGAPLRPEEVIDALFPAKDEDQVLTIVCASGGGIEASAWTARVLTGLEKQFPQSFANSIGLISSVSGGSVGAMFYLDHRYRPNSALGPEDIVGEAEVPSLSAALWGLIGPDTFRFLTYGLPIRYSKIDRGWALEQVWRGAPTSLNPKEPAIDEKFSDWRNALRQGKLPAVVFNATNVYTGYPVLIGTAEIPKHVAKPDTSTPENVIQIGDGDGQYGNADIAAATAARLSASFPYVTPVATGFCRDGRQCPEAPSDKTYLCDGGYYDNFGVWSAVNWLQAVLNDHQRRKRFKRIVILEIWSAPFDKPENLPQVNQLSAPASALLSVRTASQLARNQAEIGLLQNQYPDLIEHVIFEVPEPGPLSWMLSDRQKKQIDIDWTNALSTAAMKQMTAIFQSAPAPPARP
ncbi:MAG TPA: hypothetical protein VK782_11420 [Candidatus Sulfotelmatobacter sp.]|jgi:hypothetical protein|nr:hypothetical protein [Candidatus Sulfotelmatobacter sp.]